jgi:AraC family transcriptional regulator
MFGAAPFSTLGDGTRILLRDVGEVSFLLADSPAILNGALHHHLDLRLSFLVSGTMREVDDRRKVVQRGPHTLHLTPGHMRHGHWIDSPSATTLCFDLPSDLIARLAADFEFFDRPALIKSGSTIPLLTKLHREMFSTDKASELILTGLVYEIVGELARRDSLAPTSGKPPWLRRARDLLRDRMHENVTVNEIAEAVGVHPSHLTRMFRVHLSASPGEYLRRVRIEWATREVILGDLPLKEIALKAGYSDQSHFSREFRRVHGESPLRVRQSRNT